MKTLGYVFSFILMFFYNLLAWSLVTWKFWYWFILPILPSLPAISYVQAMGVGLFIGLFKTYAVTIKDQYIDASKTIALFLISPPLSLFMGWLVLKLFL
jgi:hypothetical protein